MDYKEKVIALLNSRELSKEQKEKLESIFPELKESEDEKIRKRVIALVNAHGQGMYKDDMIAWLEKQGGSIKEHNVCETCDEQASCVNPCPMKLVEKQGEQKAVDNIEPKFKIGDYIVNDYCMGRIVEITNDAYLLDTEQGIPFSSHSIRLWDITKDAKDGDVLSDGTTIFIFEDLLSDGSVMSYCDYDVDSGESDVFCPLSKNLVWSKFTPATKEQRDLLFQKMKEAGYEWDAEKKELKKIEQKPAENEELTEFDKAVGVSIGTWNPKTPEQIQSVKAVSKKLLKLAKKQINDELKVAWSGEDLNFLTDIEYLLRVIKMENRSDNEYQIAEKCIDWLKSLKDRVQPKQEWSEEDAKALNRISAILVDASEVKNWWKEYRLIERDEMIRLTNFLKSLRPQNHWKPSDEQMEALERMINFAHFNEVDNRDIVRNLLSQLKKLREE